MADDHRARNHHTRNDVPPSLPIGGAGARVRRLAKILFNNLFTDETVFAGEQFEQELLVFL